MQLIECVPNFSEGKNLEIINTITEEIKSIDNVKLLDVDPGIDTNRTVVTFVGDPQSVIDAAFLAIKKASEIIDMRNHIGAHARMGATDVCPLVPISNITMKETIQWSKKLAKKVADQLQIPIFLYEKSSISNSRSNLADIRKGEFEEMGQKIKKSQWKPDYGPQIIHQTAGVTAIGARNFLIAYNINLNTMDRKIATDIALDIREKGRFKRDKSGKVIRDNDGKILRVPGSLKSCKAVGWYIDEYKQAQVSMNLVDFQTTPPHMAFEEVRKQARNRGVRVTGSELVGLIPLEAMLEIGTYYLNKQKRSVGVPDSDILQIAIKSLGLDEISNFDPKEKIIEYQIEKKYGQLVNLKVDGFIDELSSDSPAPGGGSSSALIGSIGAALAAMVANLTIGKKGFESTYLKMNNLAVEAQSLKKELLKLIDEDTNAFNEIMIAFRQPKKTSKQIKQREKSIQKATKNAANIPFIILTECIRGLDLVYDVSRYGNPNSITDAGVANEALFSAAKGAFLNVRVNLLDIEDKVFCRKMMDNGNKLIEKGQKVFLKINSEVELKLNV